jgi:MFS family permease
VALKWKTLLIQVISKYINKTFSSLIKSRKYRGLFLALFTSQIGTHIQDVAQIWFVLGNSNSTVRLEIVTACLYGPYFLLGPFLPGVINLLNPKNAMLGCQVIAMTCAFSISILFFFDAVNYATIYIFAVIRGLVMMVNNPVRHIVVRESVERALLPNGIALHSFILNFAKIIGPLIGGVLLAYTNYGLCFFINGMSYIFIILTLYYSSSFTAFKPKGETPVRINGLNPFRQYRNILKPAMLRKCFFMLFIISILGFNFSISLPFLANNVLKLSSVGLGVITAVFSAGCMLGALASAFYQKSNLKSISICGIIFSLAYMLLGCTAQFYSTGIILFILGISFSYFTTSTNSFLQINSLPDDRTNVIAFYSYLITGINPVGAFVFGILSRLFFPQFCFIASGALIFIASMLILLSEPRRGYYKTSE